LLTVFFDHERKECAFSERESINVGAAPTLEAFQIVAALVIEDDD
jgi:hypothetical protein